MIPNICTLFSHRSTSVAPDASRSGRNPKTPNGCDSLISTAAGGAELFPVWDLPVEVCRPGGPPGGDLRDGRYRSAHGGLRARSRCPAQRRAGGLDRCGRQHIFPPGCRGLGGRSRFADSYPGRRYRIRDSVGGPPPQVRGFWADRHRFGKGQQRPSPRTDAPVRACSPAPCRRAVHHREERHRPVTWLPHLSRGIRPPRAGCRGSLQMVAPRN